jgi:hypothetical protein
MVPRWPFICHSRCERLCQRNLAQVCASTEEAQERSRSTASNDYSTLSIMLWWILLSLIDHLLRRTPGISNIASSLPSCDNSIFTAFESCGPIPTFTSQLESASRPWFTSRTSTSEKVEPICCTRSSESQNLSSLHRLTLRKSKAIFLSYKMIL